MRDIAKAGWRVTLPVQTMRVSTPWHSMCCWNSDRRTPDSGGSGPGTCATPCRAPDVVRGRTNTSGRWRNSSTAGRSFACACRGSARSFSSCTRPKAAESSEGSKFHPTSSKMKRLSYSRSSSMDEKNRRSVPFLRPEELDLRPPAPAAQQQAAVGQVVVVEAHHAAGACGGDDVTERERGHRNVRPGAGGRTTQRGPEASHESSTTARPCSSATARMASQSGALPMRFGSEDGFGPRSDHLLDGGDVDVVRVRLHVDERRDGPRPEPAARCRWRR